MSYKIVLAVVVLLLFGAALFYYFYAGNRTPPGQTRLAELTPDSIPAFKAAFNAAQSEVGVLVLLSPT